MFKEKKQTMLTLSNLYKHSVLGSLISQKWKEMKEEPKAIFSTFSTGANHIFKLIKKKKKKFLASKIAILHFITLSLKTQSNVDQTVKLTKSPNCSFPKTFNISQL